MMTTEEILKLINALCSAPAETDATVWEEKLMTLLELAVRTLDCDLLASQVAHPEPSLPLVKSEEFPLPEALAPAAAYLTAYLASGDAVCKSGYESAIDRYCSRLGAIIAPVVDRYEF